MAYCDRDLIALLIGQASLDWRGVHGVAHWARVRAIGLRLAARTGADARVVELFAFLHDSCRDNDGHDPDHGSRAADLARQLNDRFLYLDSHRLSLLAIACRDHTRGYTSGDVTVLTCWDADRLDLGRIGIVPHPEHLCTDAARDPQMIGWAHARSRRNDWNG